MGRPVTPRQSSGGEFSGTSQQNTLQPKARVSDMTAKEKRRLIVTTGQLTDPNGTARARNFQGQAGDKPREPLPPRYGA